MCHPLVGPDPLPADLPKPLGRHRTRRAADDPGQVDPLDDVLGERDEVELGDHRVEVGASHHRVHVDAVDDPLQVHPRHHVVHVDPAQHGLQVGPRHDRVHVDAVDDPLQVHPRHHVVHVDPAQHRLQVGPRHDRVHVDAVDDPLQVHPRHDAVHVDPVDDALQVHPRHHGIDVDPGDEGIDVDVLGDHVVEVEEPEHSVDEPGSHALAHGVRGSRGDATLPLAALDDVDDPRVRAQTPARWRPTPRRARTAAGRRSPRAP